MWKLTIERTYKKMGFEREYDVTDEMVLNFPYLGHAHEYMEITQKYAEGELKYHLEYVAKEGEENA